MTSTQDDGIDNLCARLNIPAKTAKTARDILDDLLIKCPDEFASRDRLCWFTCLVYTVSVDSRYPYGLTNPHLPDSDLNPQINLTDLLTVSRISVKTFFELLSVVKEYCFLSDAVLQTIRRLEKNYCILTVLFNKLDKMFSCVFVKTDRERTLSEQLQMAEYRKKKDLCWSIFLVSRVELIPSEQELSTAFAILLCSVALVVVNTSDCLLRAPYDSIVSGAATVSVPGNEAAPEPDRKCRAVLERVSEEFGASVVDVSQVYDHYWLEFQASLPQEDGQYDIEKLHDKYLTSYEVDADVDALRFLHYDNLLYPVDLWNQGEVKDKEPTTPVSSVLTRVQHLDDLVRHLEDSPSEGLITYCKNCSEDPWPSMERRLSVVRTKFMSEYRTAVGNQHDTVCEQRFRAARKLYYHLLQLLVNMEEEMARCDFNKLLSHDVFHRALLACSIEIVLVSHRLTYNPLTGCSHVLASRLSFPWVLTVTEISSYDFYKPIERCIRAEPRLTKDVVKHLQMTENEILDSIAWAEGSPLFDAIKQARVHSLPAVLSAASPAQQPSVSTQDIFSSPLPVRDAVSSSPSRSDSESSNKPTCSTSLNYFYNKVSGLAYHRLNVMCDKLDIDADQQRRIWTCLQYCIIHKPELIKGRHLDQILLCSIYSVCKVSGLDIKFKAIVNAYRRMHNTSPMIYKAVLIHGNIHDSIIGFYNEVFLEPMKKTIMEFSPQRPAPPLSPVPQVKQASAKTSPSYRVSGNFYVSPLKYSPFKVPLTPSKLTPRMKRLYSFGEQLGSCGVFRSINESMKQLKRLRFNDGKAQAPRSLKRLKFDTETESDVRVNDDSQQSAFSRRLAETRGDRGSSPAMDVGGED